VKKLIGLTALVAALSASAVTLAAAKPDAPLAGATHIVVSGIKADGSAVSVTIDRGTVNAYNAATSITLDEGASNRTITLSSSTKVLGAPAKGQKALVVSRSGAAMLVASRPADAAKAVKEAKPKAGRAHHRRADGLRGLVHADVSATKEDGTKTSFAYDRGEITAVSAGSVTFKRPDGKSVTLTTGSDTSLKGATKALADLAIGQRGVFFSRSGHAFLIAARTPKA
jgi:hypothetical protein